MIGEELYGAFFRGYTRKQWGLDPTLLPASILQRLPLRFDYNDGCSTIHIKGYPKEGYTEIVAAILERKISKFVSAFGLRISMNNSHM